jgi:predicted RecB family nuclease
MGFEEKVARAVQEMTTIQGIEREAAEQLVKGGFHSLEGLLAADLNDLTDIFGAEKAAAIQQAAIAEQERREASRPAKEEPKA